jgi:hypothetical protein
MPPSDPVSDLKAEVDKLLGKLDVELYGFFKLDMSSDTAETNMGDNAFYVKNYARGERDEEFNMTAKHTRFGLRYKPSEFEGVKVFGNLEIDFYGKEVSQNTETVELQSGLRLRHAYAKFDFGSGWSLLFGQTADSFAGLDMKMLNSMLGWGGGNAGYRRPQLRVEKIFDLDAEGRTKLSARFALARPVARDQDKDDDDVQDDGEDSGKPDLQARAAISFPAFTSKPAEIGLGGFYGWRELGGNGTNLSGDEHYKAFMVCLDFLVPIADGLSVLGEAWIGQGTDGYRGGVWQSYSNSGGNIEVIDAKGGWVNVVVKPAKKWQVVLGAGRDDPEDRDFQGKQGRYANSTIHLTITWNFYRGATVGLEYQKMTTDWMDNKNRTNHRIQMSFKLDF